MSLLETPRLRLRPWRDADREPFAALNADPEVAEFLPGPILRAQSDAMVDRGMALFAELGFGPWAVEVKGGAPFIGFVGLLVPRFEASFTPCVEVGWRLARDHWGRGYATEGAEAVLAHAFGPLGMAEIMSFTVPANVRSRAVMARLGFQHDPQDNFEHPLLPEGHALRPHVLYRLSAEAWRTRQAARSGGAGAQA